MAGSSSQNKSPGSGFQGQGSKTNYSSTAKQSYNTVISANQRANAPKNTTTVTKNNKGFETWWGPGRGRGVSGVAVGVKKPPVKTPVIKPPAVKKPVAKKPTMVTKKPSATSKNTGNLGGGKTSQGFNQSRSTVGGGISKGSALALSLTGNKSIGGTPQKATSQGGASNRSGNSGLSRSTVGGGVSGAAARSLGR